MQQADICSVLRDLIEGGNLSQYGLINALTRTAEDAKSYDRATARPPPTATPRPDIGISTSSPARPLRAQDTTRHHPIARSTESS